MRVANRIVAGVSALAAAAALAGCGGGASAGKAAGSTSPVATAAAGGATGNTIVIKSFTFVPSMLTVKVGQQVTVTNMDSAVHTITANDKSFDSKDLTQGKTYTFTPSKAGTFTYTCSIHQYMTGTLVVS